MAVVTGALFLAGVAFLAFHHAVYGGWTAYAAGDHFVGGEATVMGNHPNYAGRSVRLVGLLTDRTFGLAAWQPAFLLAAPALAALARRRPPGWFGPVAALGAGWLTATFVALTMQGWWWPGRQVVAVVPLLVLAVAWWLGRSAPSSPSARRAVGAFAVVAAVGVVATVFVFVEATTGRTGVAVDFFRTADPLYRAWSHVLPDYLRPGPATWVLHGAWIAVLAGLATWGWRAAAAPPAPAPVGAPIDLGETTGVRPAGPASTTRPLAMTRSIR